MTVPTGASPSVADLHRAALRARLGYLGVSIVGLLVAEFLLGMALNLFVTLPTGSALHVLESSPVLGGHLLVAALLLGITANATRLALGLRERRAVGGAALALVSAIGATLAGLSFTFGPGGDAASYAMSIGFAGVLIGAGLLLSLGRVPADQGMPRPSTTAGTPGGGGP
ncbi:MAG: hypothetical protein ACRECT_02745 [Thermoplasmata archaeon]